MRPLARAASTVGLCLVVVLVLSACLRNPRTGAPVANPANNTPANSWVGSAPDGTVLLVQLTRAGQTVQGTLDVSYFSDQTTVSSTHAGFSGLIDGTNITLNFPELLGVVSTVSGSIDSATLALNFPDPTAGNLFTVMLHAGGLDKYNAAVDVLRVKAADNLRGQAVAEASAKADAQLRGASDTVAGDVDKLQVILSNGVSFADLDGALATAANELATTKAQAQTAISEGAGSYSGCYDAGTAKYDAGTVEYDQGTVTYDQGTAQSTIDAVSQLVAKLRQDFANAEAVFAGQGKVIDSANASAVDTAISKANAAVKTWTSKVASYRSKAQQLVDQANAAADAATKAVCP